MTYCDARPSFVLTPNRMSRALIVPGPTCPWNFDSIASAGLPGISRGSRKLRVSAAHSVNTKKPRRRSANLKLVSWSSWPAPHGQVRHRHDYPRRARAGGACPQTGESAGTHLLTSGAAAPAPCPGRRTPTAGRRDSPAWASRSGPGYVHELLVEGGSGTAALHSLGSGQPFPDGARPRIALDQDQVLHGCLPWSRIRLHRNVETPVSASTSLVKARETGS